MAFNISRNAYCSKIFSLTSVLAKSGILIKDSSKWATIRRSYSEEKNNPVQSAFIKELNKPVSIESDKRAAKLKPGEVILDTIYHIFVSNINKVCINISVSLT